MIINMLFLPMCCCKYYVCSIHSYRIWLYFAANASHSSTSSMPPTSTTTTFSSRQHALLPLATGLSPHIYGSSGLWLVMLWKQRPVAHYVMAAAAYGSLCYGSSGLWLVMLWQQRPMARCGSSGLWLVVAADVRPNDGVLPTFQLLQANISVITS